MKNLSIVGTLGVIVGIFGVVGPIAWDYYKTKSEIELQLIEHSPIVEKSKQLDGLIITYAGETVEQLSRLTFSLRNTGRTPILRKDIVSPIYIKTGRPADIIEARVAETLPPDIEASISNDKTDGKISVDFSLLNPGDKINVAVLTKSPDASFEAGARIAGISSLTIAPALELGANRPRNTTWTMYASGIFSLLMAFAGIAGIGMAVAELKVKNLFRCGSFSLPPFNTREEVRNYLSTSFGFTTRQERIPLNALLDNLADSDAFGLTHRDAITNGIERLIKNALPNVPVAIVLFAFAILGAWYTIAGL